MIHFSDWVIEPMSSGDGDIITACRIVILGARLIVDDSLEPPSGDKAWAA